jgi:hypothetical protein
VSARDSVFLASAPDGLDGLEGHGGRLHAEAGTPGPMRSGGAEVRVLFALCPALVSAGLVLADHGRPDPAMSGPARFLRRNSLILVFGTVWLVQRGSPESKPLADIGRETDEQQKADAYATPESPLSDGEAPRQETVTGGHSPRGPPCS